MEDAVYDANAASREGSSGWERVERAADDGRPGSTSTSYAATSRVARRSLGDDAQLRALATPPRVARETRVVYFHQPLEQFRGFAVHRRRRITRVGVVAVQANVTNERRETSRRGRHRVRATRKQTCFR
jgi:hypothetical protein